MPDRSKRKYLSGETLAQKLGVSQNAVWKAVRLLQDEGFPIEAKKKTATGWHRA
ncbi:MAG: HTH domain-containing protein [Ruminococcus callidus]